MFKTWIAASVILAACAVARAERPPQIPTDTVEGVVERVFVRVDGAKTEYLIELKVEKVVEGKNVKADAVVRVEIFQAKLKPGFVGATGHTPVPKEGEAITAKLVHLESGHFEGAYKEWASLLTKSK